MQPLAGSDAADRLISVGKDRQYVPVNSEAFWKKKSDEVAAEDVFFHEYFNRLGKDKKGQKEKKDKDPVERDEEGEDIEDEDEIWKALVNSKPEVEGKESDDDLDMDDLESAYDDDAEDGDAEEGEGDEGVIFNDESDEEMDDGDLDADEGPEQPAKSTAKKPRDEEEPSDDDDDFNMDVSDDEAFIGSDEELPVDMGDKDDDKDDAKSERKKRRKLKHLPTFASADDYAALLAGEDEGM